jgi:methyltransferase (TIGR00027 family)
MSKDGRLEAHEPNDESSAVPFTARLNAYYRAIESKRANPLLTDPYAEQLAGNMTEYFEKHKRFTEIGGSQIARSYHIENDLLEPWCTAHEKSQIVLLGAGLDTRAYRLSSLQKGSHIVFELDLPIIIDYKERVLRKEQPLCSLIRISTDLSRPEWKTKLSEHGFSHETATLWVLEGLVYYLDKTVVQDLVRVLSEMSTNDSQLFLDVCVPALADLRWGPFADHFKWGITMEDIPLFFATAGWSVSCSYLDEYSHGMDVGQKGLILVHGTRNVSGLDDVSRFTPNEGQEISASQLREFSHDLMIRIIPEIEEVLNIYARDSEKGLLTYIDFIKRTQSDLRAIAEAQKNPILLGKISPRLLGDPLSIEREAHGWSGEEIESYIVGYLTASLQLVYCGMKGLDADQYRSIPLHGAPHRSSDSKGLESLRSLLTIMKREANF